MRDVLTRAEMKRTKIFPHASIEFEKFLKTTGLPSTNAALKTNNCLFYRSILVLWVYLILFVEDKAGVNILH